MIPIFYDMTKGSTREKIEGICVTAKGDIWVNNDNDGVDDNSGENFFAIVGNVALADDVGISPTANPNNTPGGTPPTASTAPTFFALPAAVFAITAVLFYF